MTAGERLFLHGTVVSLDGAGVLLTGRPGSGKSTLALRLIDQPGCGLGDTPVTTRLVADDQVVLCPVDGTLLAGPPQRLAGLIEVRGVGLVRVDHADAVPLVLEARLQPGREPERLPDVAAQGRCFGGIHLPAIDLDPDHPAAPARLRAAVQALVAGRLGEACA